MLTRYSSLVHPAQTVLHQLRKATQFLCRHLGYNHINPNQMILTNVFSILLTSMLSYGNVVQNSIDYPLFFAAVHRPSSRMIFVHVHLLFGP